MSLFLIVATFLASFLFAAPALAQQTPVVNQGPVSVYKFKAAPSWKFGRMNLSWTDNGSADRYNLLYGTKPGKYTYGVISLPFTPFAKNNFPVNFLKSDKIYYFALIAFKNGEFVYMTPPVSAISN